jgi:hypothetical protein
LKPSLGLITSRVERSVPVAGSETNMYGIKAVG